MSIVKAVGDEGLYPEGSALIDESLDGVATGEEMDPDSCDLGDRSPEMFIHGAVFRILSRTDTGGDMSGVAAVEDGWQRVCPGIPRDRMQPERGCRRRLKKASAGEGWICHEEGRFSEFSMRIARESGKPFWRPTAPRHEEPEKGERQGRIVLPDCRR